jgi:hypothetical protein
MKHFITFVGLDVHKDTVDIAVAESGDNKEVRHYGKSMETSRHWIKPSGSSGVRARNSTLSMKPVPADMKFIVI